jgi:hypothetical protein
MHEYSFNATAGSRPTGGPVTCAVCGCRLTPADGLEGTAWRHFEGQPGQDARGCRPSCVADLHRSDGSLFQPLETLMESPALS